MPFRFCPYCGQPLEEKMRFGQVRPTCPACHFVYFRDPKVAVIALVLHRGRVLLIKRAVDPGKGLWALPGGYMDAGEMPQAALQREMMEEVGLPIQVDELLAIYPMTNGDGVRTGIVLAFQASLAAGHRLTDIGDDAAAAGWFGPADLPDGLAFESTQTLIQSWLEKANASPPTYSES